MLGFISDHLNAAENFQFVTRYVLIDIRLKKKICNKVTPENNRTLNIRFKKCVTTLSILLLLQYDLFLNAIRRKNE